MIYKMTIIWGLWFEMFIEMFIRVRRQYDVQKNETRVQNRDWQLPWIT